MIGWIVTSSVLIGIVSLLRTLLKGRISLRLQYALWLMVLVRLLVPFDLAVSGMSVLNAVPDSSSSPFAAESVSIDREDPALSDMPQEPQIKPSTVGQAALEPSASSDRTALLQNGAGGMVSVVPDAPGSMWLVGKKPLRLVWLIGAAAMSAVFLISNLLFSRRLRRCRTSFASEETRLPVFLAEGLLSPCLFGLFQPAIYITPSAAENPARLYQILTHEDTHFRHGDNWWSLARCAVLSLHWYNPLVWLAAALSRRDAELCCDEDTVRRLGEEQRIAYGRTILDMVSEAKASAGLFHCATTMTAGKRGLKERITLLAERPKTAAASLVCLLLALRLAVGCTFTGVKQPNGSNAADDSPDVPEGYTLLTTVPLDNLQMYTPENQTVTPAETPASDIVEILPDGSGNEGVLTLSDGTKVLCYRDGSSNKYWALQRGDKLIRFAQEENAYTDCYSAEAYTDVFGHDGFRIICPRGAAYTAYDYYYMDESGVPQLLAACSNFVTETDLNGDGEKELMWYYHGYEDYFYVYQGDQLYLADVNGLVQDALPEWTVSGVLEYDLESGLLPIFYHTGRSDAEHRAFLRFTPESIQVLQRVPEEITVYNCNGVKIGIPTQYVDQLIIQTDFEGNGYNAAYGAPMMKVSEKASVEAGKADGMAGGVGWIFTISRITRAQYEQYICTDRSGEFAFAAAGAEGNGLYGSMDEYAAPVYDQYYVFSTATDVQFYRGDGEISTESADWKNWEQLCDMGDDVREDMIRRNDLTAYDDNDFLQQTFTYEAGHAYVKYYPYYDFDGSTAQYDTLVLSQPQKQGEGGVWCVERFYDERGTVCPYFPSFDTIGAENVTAEEYYNRLQQMCDTGSGTDAEMSLLTPLGAAKQFVAASGWYRKPSAADGSFAQTDRLDTAYMTQNVWTQQLALDLMSGQTVDDWMILTCVEGFTADTWGVLGRVEYGSDWWTPLKDALVKAAKGDEQDRRDQVVLHLYCTYGKEEGTVAEGLREILAAAEQADPAVFNKTLRGSCTAQEQSRVQAAIAKQERSMDDPN